MRVLAAILLGGAVGLLFPGSVLWLAPALQPAFAVTMFFVGTLVRPEETRAFRRAPGRAVAGFACQYTIMPLGAWLVSLLFADPQTRMGVVLVGCMPGAMASNLMTLLFAGDVVLSVTLTTAATLACPLVLAFWLPLLADTRLALPLGPLVWNATWMVVLPVVAGALVRARRPSMPPGWDRAASAVASAAIVVILVIVVAANRDHLASLGPALFLGMLALNLGGYALAYLAATAMRWPEAQRRTLVIEVGMQNAGLGSVLALAHLGPAGAVPSAFYTVLCLVTTAAALPLRRLDRRATAAAAS